MQTVKQIRTWRDMQDAFFARHPVAGTYTAPETQCGAVSRMGTHTAHLEYTGVRDDGCPCCTEFDIQSTQRISAREGCHVDVLVTMRPGCGMSAAYSALFDHGLASKSDQRFASIRSTGNLTFSTAF